MKATTLKVPQLEFTSEFPYQTRKPSYKREGYFYTMHYPEVKVVECLTLQSRSIKNLPVDVNTERFSIAKLSFSEKLLLANNHIHYYFELFDEGLITLSQLSDCGYDFVKSLYKEEWFSCSIGENDSDLNQVRSNVRALLFGISLSEMYVITECLPDAWRSLVEPVDEEEPEEERQLLFAV